MISYRTSKSLVDCYRAFGITRMLDTYYPDFDEWYWNKVVPDTLVGQSEIIVAESLDDIVGVALVKRGEEPKLRCLRVLPQYAGKGIGVHLIDRSLRLLDADKPLVTVPEERIHDYSRILVNRFDFNLTKVDRGLYRPLRLEYQFNGQQDQRIKTPY